LHNVAATKAKAVSDSLLREALAKIDAGADDAVSAALELFDLASVSNNQDATRAAVYSGFGHQRGLRGYAGLASLVERDRGARDCLERNVGCSAELTREKWMDLLSPMIQSVTPIISQQAARLETATKGVTKGITTKTAAAFDEAIAQAKASGGACSFSPGSLEASCKRLADAQSDANAFVAAHEADMSQLRKEAAEKQRTEEQKKTTTRWRQHFAECNQLQQGIRAVESLSSCEGPCVAVVKRMRAQRDKLRAFEYSEVVADPQTLQMLVAECNAAGCETCP